MENGSSSVRPVVPAVGEIRPKGGERQGGRLANLDTNEGGRGVKLTRSKGVILLKNDGLVPRKAESSDKEQRVVAIMIRAFNALGQEKEETPRHVRGRWDRHRGGE